jgi:hypothetical protein
MGFAVQIFIDVADVLAASVFIALKMEETSTSETSVNFYQNTLPSNPDDQLFHKKILKFPQKHSYDITGILFVLRTFKQGFVMSPGLYSFVCLT